MIQVRNLTRYYGDFAALQDVSFELREGEIVGLLGLNGAGKSTALRILAGLLAPSMGDVVIDGKDLAAHPGLMARIGFLPASARRAATSSGNSSARSCSEGSGVK